MTEYIRAPIDTRPQDLASLSDTTIRFQKWMEQASRLINTILTSYYGGINVKFTSEGGLAVRMINKTGSASVQGEVLAVSDTTDNGVDLIAVDVPDPLGVFYESGIADGSYAWVVVSGIADVYFVGNTTRGNIARGFLTADGGSYVAGQALSEAYPTAPFASDKHFYEIGHVLESITGPGLAKCILHFN